jgi:hypothetical protein
MVSDAALGLFAVVLVILLSRRVGGDWRPAGKVLGVAAAAFVGAIVLRSFPDGQSGLAAAGVFTAVGFLVTVIGAMITVAGD